MDRDRIRYLSPREQEIVDLLGQGLSSKEIADKIKIAITTVSKHRANILEKCGIRSTKELLLMDLSEPNQ